MPALDPQRYRQTLQDAVPYPVLFASITGAHLYGFPSPDSDVDLRACHILPLAEVIGLPRPKETLTRSREVEGVDVDLVSHDLVPFVRFLVSQKGNYLEQLFSPLVVVNTPWAEELRALVRNGTITRHVYRAYAGYARAQWTRWRDKEPRRLKPLLYAYRVSLTGLHLLRTGEVNANLADLALLYGYPHLLELIAAKREEQATVDLPVAEHDAALAALQEKLHQAYETTSLPDKPTNFATLNDFVVRVRLAVGPPGENRQ